MCAWKRDPTVYQDNLEHVQDGQEGEEGVAVHVKGVAQLHILVDVLLHGRCLQKAVGEEPGNGGGGVSMGGQR